MMKMMLGFCGCCAAAGVLAGPDSDSDINVVAPSNAAQDRLCQLGVLRGGVAIYAGLVANTVLNMASLSLFMMRQWLLV
jgi:hypothetical protein